MQTSLSVGHRFRWSLRKKLFGYMLILVLILLLVLAAGLFLCGRFTSTQKDMVKSLGLQLEFFEKTMSTYWDEVAYRSVNLSGELTALLTKRMDEMELTSEDLTNNATALQNLQDAMMEPLKQHLQQSSCSGAFVLLDVTVNTQLDSADYSRSGLYLQKSGTGISDTDFLLYRGIAAVGKAHGVMPHRKWHMEFNTQILPDYATHMSATNVTLEKSFLISPLLTLPGTSEQVVLMSVPLMDDDGNILGLCGFEISESCFKTLHAQPSNHDQLTCMLTVSQTDALNADLGLSCGVTNGYYYKPTGKLQEDHYSSGLTVLTGDIDSYVGLVRNMRLSPRGDGHVIAVMIPKDNYDQAFMRSTLQMGLLMLLLLLFSGFCCLYFSHRFLTPVLKDLEKLKTRRRTSSGIPELEELRVALSEQDRQHEQTVTVLSMEKQSAQTEAAQLRSACLVAQNQCEAAQSRYEVAQRNYELAQNRYEAAQLEYMQAQRKYETAQAEIDRLAYDRKKEIDPEDYKVFLDGIKTLTPTEDKIFQYYLSGKTVKEIIVICSIKESTLRYHNQNIYSKLGINSLKQLLRYAALMQRENQSTS